MPFQYTYKPNRKVTIYLTCYQVNVLKSLHKRCKEGFQEVQCRTLVNWSESVRTQNYWAWDEPISNLFKYLQDMAWTKND